MIENSEENFNILSKRLVRINGMADHQHHVLKENKDLWLKNKNNENRFVHISNFAFEDFLTGKIRFLDGNFSITKEGLFESFNDLMNEHNTYSLIQSFEAFKRFIKYDLFFRLSKSENTFRSLRLSFKKDGVHVLYPFDKEGILDALTNKYRSLDSLLKLYKCFSINLDNENTNLSLIDICYITEELRHSVVHGTTITLTKNQKLILILKKYRLFESILKQNDFIYSVKISSNVRKAFNRIFASMAYHIYTSDYSSEEA